MIPPPCISSTQRRRQAHSTTTTTSVFLLFHIPGQMGKTGLFEKKEWVTQDVLVQGNEERVVGSEVVTSFSRIGMRARLDNVSQRLGAMRRNRRIKSVSELNEVVQELNPRLFLFFIHCKGASDLPRRDQTPTQTWVLRVNRSFASSGGWPLIDSGKKAWSSLQH